HARLCKYAAEGPLYIEFYQTVQGKEYIVYRHEDPDYGGEKLYTTTVELLGNIGFNKDREYRVQIVQNNGKRDLVLANSKVKLIDTGRKAEGEEEEAEGEEDEAEEDAEDEEDEEEDGGSQEAPPPIEDTPAKKKGCSVTDDVSDVGATGLGILLLAGVAAARRRRR